MILPSTELFEILIAVGESATLDQAATRLGISQPAVSLKLKELEKSSPIPVFTYEGRRKVLTHYGRELFRVAKSQQQNFTAALEALNRTYASAESLTLSVGCRRELFEATVHRLNFGGRVRFVSLTSRQSVEALMSHKVDLAISYEIPDSAEVVAKPVLESTVKFAIHKKYIDSKLTDALVRDPAFLKHTPCVLYEETGHLLTEWARYVGVSFSDLKGRAVADDWRTVQNLIDEGWGYGLVPSYVHSLNKDVVAIPLPTSVLPKYKFYAVFGRDLRKVPAFKAILEFK